MLPSFPLRLMVRARTRSRQTMPNFMKRNRKRGVINRRRDLDFPRPRASH